MIGQGVCSSLRTCQLMARLAECRVTKVRVIRPQLEPETCLDGVSWSAALHVISSHGLMQDLP